MSRIADIDRATRWPLYLASGAEPLLVLLLVNGRPEPSAGSFVVVALAIGHAAVCLALLRAGLDHVLDGPYPSRRLLGAALVLAVLGAASALLVQPPDGSTDAALDGSMPVPAQVAALALVFCGALTCALVPILSVNGLLLVVAVPAAVVAGLDGFVIDPGPPAWALGYVLVVGAQVLSYRFSVWRFGVAHELDRARGTQARLAVAEERLRFARDLHDVLGRNLALIAVNSQLAAELARREQEGAVERMLDVHRTAQESMRELREVVAGSRTADLDTELAGARSVLRAAGISVEVTGDGGRLPLRVQSALGWVVREATTNIIRHSDPTAVSIQLALEPDTILLLVENDGVRTATDGAPTGNGPLDDRPPGNALVGNAPPGNGLVGLSERLAALGGALETATQPGGRFVLRARVPLTGTVPEMIADRSPA